MKVKFTPMNVEHDIEPGQSVFDVAQKNGIFIKSVCNGVPNCAECRIRVTEGEDFTIPPNKPELGLIGTAYYVDQRRLSCQLQCFGDITVDLTEQEAKKGASSKKPRGYKGSNSHSKQDIVALEEAAPQDAAPQEAEESSGGRGRDRKRNRRGGKKPRGQAANRTGPSTGSSEKSDSSDGEGRGEE